MTSSLVFIAYLVASGDTALHSAAADLTTKVALIRFTTGGLVEMELPSRKTRDVSLHATGVILSVAPTMAAYVASRVEGSGGSRELAVYLVQGGAGQCEVGRTAAASRTSGPVVQPSVQWGGPNFDAAFVQLGTELWLADCRADVNPRRIATEIAAFLISGERLYYVAQNLPRTLQWRRLSIAAESSTDKLDTGIPINVLASAGGCNEVVLARRGDVVAGLTALRLANVAKRTVLTLGSPKGVVLDIVPVTGSSTALVELWNTSDERVDGSPRSVFWLWNYHTNSLHKVVSNQRDWKAMSLLGNICTDG